MKTLFPGYIGFTFPLLVIQTYLLVYVTLLLLRRMKLLKKPYSGMEYSESLLASIVILGVLLISSANAPGIFQAAKSYGDNYASIGEPFLLFFARSFVVILFFSLLFIGFNFLNIRLLFRGYLQDPGLSASILICAIAVGFVVVCWFTCRELVDDMTPKIINFQF